MSANVSRRGWVKRFLGWKNWPSLAPWLAALTAIVALCYTIHNNTESHNEQDSFQWKRTIVYRIIDEATRDTGETISFSEIENKYNTEARREERIHLSKKDLQELEIRRILMTLETDKLIGHTPDKRYYIYRNNPCGNELTPAGGLAQKKILLLLKNNPEKFNANELFDELESRYKVKISNEEYSLVISCLLARQLVGFYNYKLYSTAYPPPPEKHSSPIEPIEPKAMPKGNKDT